MNIHKDYKLLKPIRKLIVNKALIRIVLDKDKLTGSDSLLLAIILISYVNKITSNYQYSIEIHKANNGEKENEIIE